MASHGLLRLFGLSSLPLLVLFSALPTSLASLKNPSMAARKEDIPFIKCQVCEKIAHQIHQQVKKKETQLAPKKVSVFQVIKIAENACNLRKEEADWIIRIDIVEKGFEEKFETWWDIPVDKRPGKPRALEFPNPTLVLVDQGIEGECASECKTVERACQEVMGYSDTDVAEFIFIKKPSIDLLVNFLRNDLSKACSVKPPPVPKDRIPGEPFYPRPPKEAEMGKTLRSMERMPGVPNMKVYPREDLTKLESFGDEEVDDEDDEEDDRVPSNLGNILDSPKNDFKDKILQHITETRAAFRGRIDRVTSQIKSWWNGKKRGSIPPKAGKTEL